MKNKLIGFLLCGIILTIYFISNTYQNMTEVNRYYNVYLDGKIIGSINDKDELYKLIDEKQQGIKDKFGVNNVYPPSSLQVIETYSYNPTISSLDTVYNKIEEMQDFTILGYEIEVTKEKDDSNEAKDFKIYVLDKEVFETALRSFILAFISEEDLEDYLNGTQENLNDIGKYYDEMEILEDITIRRKRISVNNKIYESSEELAQELLFGFNYEEKLYTIKSGDTIESISEANTLNTQEFLIANPKYSSKDALLAIGDKVNITLIDPELSFSYTISERKENEYKFEEIVDHRDNTQPSSYKSILRAGVTGISIETSHYNVVNGEPNNEVVIDPNPEIVREKIDQLVVRGREYSFGNSYEVDTGEGWKWPTQSPYLITSEFAPRWGKHHNGMDISGPGEGSNIYAVTAGQVITVVTDCPNYGTYGSRCGSGFGNHVVIDHGNGLYTTYAHMSDDVPVVVGQMVSRGTILGHMNRSGSSTGVHLHFGVSIGSPENYVNPRSYLFR